MSNKLPDGGVAQRLAGCSAKYLECTNNFHPKGLRCCEPTTTILSSIVTRAAAPS